jgi:hypothetical protein
MRADYTQITEPDLQAQVRARYSAEIQSLTAIRFHPLCFYLEQLGPFSALLQLPILLLMLSKKEVLAIRRPLRLGAGFMLLAHPQPPAIALPMGMGVKLYSSFTDGSLLISSTFAPAAVPGPGSPIAKITGLAGTQDTWRLHQDRLRQLEEGGKIVQAQTSFDTYIAMSRQEEDTRRYVFVAA